MRRRGFVYILGSNRPTLYIGVTSDLIKRVYEHKQGLVKGFSKKYKLHKLLYYEVFDDVNVAIKREKQLKNWHRDWKLNLIRSKNPTLKDLFPEVVGS
ncbi:MAG: GIY-YIG nuclease family protein [Cyanobacteriota bacterium]